MFTFVGRTYTHRPPRPPTEYENKILKALRAGRGDDRVAVDTQDLATGRHCTFILLEETAERLLHLRSTK